MACHIWLHQLVRSVGNCSGIVVLGSSVGCSSQVFDENACLAFVMKRNPFVLERGSLWFKSKGRD